MDSPEGIDHGSGERLVGVIADTHADGLPADLPHAIVEALSGVDLILHAGDIGSASVITALEEIAPVIAVRGNTASDLSPSVGQLPRVRRVEVVGRVLALTHGDLHGPWRKRAPRGKGGTLRALLGALDRPPARRAMNGVVLARLVARFQGRADCVVFGHTHVPFVRRVGGTLYLNPGDAQYRPQARVHLGLLHLARGEPVRAELRSIELPT